MADSEDGRVRFSKQVLSQHLRTQCDRQLRLSLYTDKLRKKLGMPGESKVRASIPLLKKAGDKWQAKAFGGLAAAFGEESIVGVQREESKYDLEYEYKKTPLKKLIGDAAPGRYIVESKYPVTETFKEAVGGQDITDGKSGKPLEFTALVPDAIEVLGGEEENLGGAVEPSGTVASLSEDDTRFRLRVIDVKLSSEPSANYFAEVVYYSMALAAWLEEQDLDDQFVVVESAAVWPGAHQGSALDELIGKWEEEWPRGNRSTSDARAALWEDLEAAPFSVFASRVRRLIGKKVPSLLSKEDWREHDWHVAGHCEGCDFLGFWGDKKSDPKHCWPMAKRGDDLSRVPQMPRGASGMLKAKGVEDLNDLASKEPGNEVFEDHQELRARRTVMPSRAASLVEAKKEDPLPEEMKVVAKSGTSAVLRKFSNLNVYLFVEFDLSSAISFAFGLKAAWWEPKLDDSHSQKEKRQKFWDAQVFVVDERSVKREREALLAFLKHLRSIAKYVHEQDEKAKGEGRRTKRQFNTKSAVQFYLWDAVQREHLMRVIGRHLEAILASEDLGDLAWLFPSDALIPNWESEGPTSPITIIGDVADSHLAVPVPHMYTLMRVVEEYHETDKEDPYVPWAGDYYKKPLSELIPSERGHEMWSGNYPEDGFPGARKIANYIENTVEEKIRALEIVTRRLQDDLNRKKEETQDEEEKEKLSIIGAPDLAKVGPPKRLKTGSWDASLWRAFQRLNAALDKEEKQQVRSLPPHEREARFKSARLHERIRGEEAKDVLDEINEKQARTGSAKLEPKDWRYVYKMRDKSRDVSFKEDEFLVAISSEWKPNNAGLIDTPITKVMEGTPVLERHKGDAINKGQWFQGTMQAALRGKIEAIDREEGYLVFKPKNPEVVEDLEAEGVIDLNKNVVLDPIEIDFFESKLKESLKEIGNPEVASASPNVKRATGLEDNRQSPKAPHTPAAGFLWKAKDRHEERRNCDTKLLKAGLEDKGEILNPSQWNAFSEALTRNLTLIWGPPGTGKSRTLRAIIKGAVMDAARKERPLRLLVTAPTYRALDEVLLKAHKQLPRVLPEDAGYQLRRVRSKWSSKPEGNLGTSIDLKLNKYAPSERVRDLRRWLIRKEGITIVGATPGQTHNLMQAAPSEKAQEELFDLAVLDEASQVDVAHAILPLCALAEGGGLILAGDDKQLPPIHQAEPPEGLENMVGSVYNFFSKHHGVEPEALDLNYRSSKEVVGFCRNAGYDESLRAFSPNLKLRFPQGLPQAKPEEWPGHLHWQPELNDLLDPEKPVGCFAYEDEISGQSNPFEADRIASLLFLLSGRLAEDLENEKDERGNIEAPSDRFYKEEDFWNEGVGVVTPHKAQRSRIITALRKTFPATDPSLLRGAVDTVERFQGQERDIIIGSFGLGDPDAIKDEDEFLYNLNRFNVMASRARAKLLVFATRTVIDHLPGDLDTLRESRLLKSFADAYCNEETPMTLSYLPEEGPEEKRSGNFRHKKR
jgi:hypothetical protein